MWSDNEAEVDLLGFDYLVDSLIAVLGESHLLPLTVGINGDWGSGKSSLMRMAARRLNEEDTNYLVIEFSPWVHEDRQDVKSSLIATILDELDCVTPESGRDHLKRLWGVLTTLARRSSVPTARLAAAGASLAGVPPELALPTAEAVGGAVAASGDVAESPHEPIASEVLAPREFRILFSKLIATLQQCTVVILVDDLDRCLPDTVVDTLEAIRLFLSVPNTAYVIAAHRQMVEAAIDRRYPVSDRDEGSIGRDYLEKMLQVTINIPPLSEPEAETYLNLLLCDLHLDTEDFGRVVAEAASQYREAQLTIAINEGRVAEVLGELAPALATDLRWVTAIAPAIAGGLRGNPRQLKRFLNTLRLRATTSEIRGVSLDHATLAKLMVLEEIDSSAFETLFRWQMEHAGRPPELATAEGGAIAIDVSATTEESQNGAEADARDEMVAWSRRTAVARWLTLEPPLADCDLRPYFYLCRDRFAPGGLTARLPAALQRMIGQLSVASNPRRRSAIQEALALGAEEIQQLSLALADRARRSPRDPATNSLIEMAAVRESLWPILGETLGAMSLPSVPPAIPPILLTQFKGAPPPEIVAVLDTWEAQEVVPQLAAAVHSARMVTRS